MVLAALSARATGFCFPWAVRSGHRVGVRPASTRVGRLLMGGADVEARPQVTDVTRDMIDVKSSFLRTLIERGFYNQCTDLGGLDEKLCGGEVITAYLGFDATADRYVEMAALCPLGP